MYKIKRLSNLKYKELREFTSSSNKKMKFPDIKRLVKDNIKKHKETYELLSK
jgi:hypothetical protein